MYLLRCPQGHSLPVSPKSAGSQVVCPECGSRVDVPKLGELRQFPQARAEGTPAAPRRSLGFGARLGFALLMLGGLLAGISAGYAGLRWRSLPVPATTDQHVEMEQAEISQLPPATLVNVWEQYERMGLGVRHPFPYQHLHEIRSGWRRICLISLGIALVCVVLAGGVALLGRQRVNAPDT